MEVEVGTLLLILMMESMSERVDDYQDELSDYGQNYGFGNDGGPLRPNERK